MSFVRSPLPSLSIAGPDVSCSAPIRSNLLVRWRRRWNTNRKLNGGENKGTDRKNRTVRLNWWDHPTSSSSSTASQLMAREPRQPSIPTSTPRLFVPPSVRCADYVETPVRVPICRPSSCLSRAWLEHCLWLSCSLTVFWKMLRCNENRRKDGPGWQELLLLVEKQQCGKARKIRRMHRWIPVGQKTV